MTQTQRPRAYSYVRFSTPDQMRGDSFRRQTEMAERYAALHGLDMDTKFIFHDLGVSAFRGRNRAEGMLGEFLDYVRSGDITRGSYLLVENLDRVSRENALDALDTLKDIAREGVTVVTLNDGREYTHESLRRNPIDLMVAVMMFMRANEESETKARRLREAWSAKRNNISDKPLTSISPGWLLLRDDRSAFDVIPERVAVVRRVFDMRLAGKGQHDIAATLNREGVPVFGRGTMWHRSYIMKLLADQSVIGNYTPHRMERIEGKQKRIPTETVEGYFPAIIDRDKFERVRSLTGGRASPSKAGMANMLSGLAKCPLCGSTMTRVYKGKRGGRPRLVCTRAKAGAGCEYRAVPIDDVEQAIVRHAQSLLADIPSVERETQAELDRLTTAESGAADEVERLVEAIAATGHSAALIERLREAEAAREALRRQVVDAEQAVMDTLTNRIVNTATVLVDTIEVEPIDVPQVNALLRQLFSAVTIDYLTGYLGLRWKHTDVVSSLMFMWPSEPGGRERSAVQVR